MKPDTTEQHDEKPSQTDAALLPSRPPRRGSLVERSPPKPHSDNILASSLRVGSACAAAGFIFGGFSGILRGTTPLLFATASSIQTFMLATTFWASRTSILQTWNSDSTSAPTDRARASALAGGFSGATIALITRGRRNVLPAALMWSIFAGLGQLGADRITLPRDTTQESLWRRLAKKDWSPVTVLSDEEYATVLEERLLKINAEIAIMDDRITALRKSQEIEMVEPIPKDETG